MDATDDSWFAVILEIMGEGKGLTFMRRLAEKDLYLRDGKTLITRLMAAGEFPIVANTYVDLAMDIVKTGAPIEWLPGHDPIPASTHLVGIYGYAPHPNAAKLYVDFVLSKEGQNVLANRIGKFPANPDVESYLKKKTDGFKIYALNPAVMSRYDLISKQFREIFWKN